jgi:anhydro-N-acetylmuramic acid kinase
MDGWMSQQQDKAYDADGAWAQSGTVDEALLQRFLSEPYFLQSAPKSTGREQFNASWLETMLEGLEIKPNDVQATLLELTVCTIAQEIQKFNIARLLVCGGGVKNAYLMQRLSELLETVEVATTDAYGLSSDFMEAMAFAWLAYKRLNHETVALKAVTGATKNAILGGIYAAD